MKFRFRLETVMRQRKIERDMAQREYMIAQAAVREQMALIQRMYEAIDQARERAQGLQVAGGACAPDLLVVEQFVVGQKVKIAQARQRARELMAVEEEKQEVLAEKAQAFKILEKLREKKKEEFKIEQKKKDMKRMDDIVTMKYSAGGNR